MMKHIPTVYLISMPYLVFFLLFQMTRTNGSWIALLLIVLAEAFVLLMGIVSCVICNIVSIKSMSDKESVLRNFYIKIGHIPAHMMVIAVVLGFMNPFLFLVSWVPAACGVGLLVYSGAANISACIMLWRNKKCTFTEAVIFAVVAFIGIADFVSAVFQQKKAMSPPLIQYPNPQMNQPVNQYANPQMDQPVNQYANPQMNQPVNQYANPQMNPPVNQYANPQINQPTDQFSNNTDMRQL